MSQIVSLLVLSFFITISILAFVFSLITYNEAERARRAITRRLLSLDHAVRLILQELDNAFDHVGRANDDLGARLRQVPAIPSTDGEEDRNSADLAAKQEARLETINKRRRWTASAPTDHTEDSIVHRRPAHISFNEWLESLVPLNTPARDQIIALQAGEAQNTRHNLTNGTRSPSLRHSTRATRQNDQSTSTDALNSILRHLRPAPTLEQVDAILANFADLIRHRNENEAHRLPARFRHDLSFVLWLAIRQVEPRISQEQTIEILEQFPVAYQPTGVSQNRDDARSTVTANDSASMVARQSDRLIKVPMPPIPGPLFHNDDTSSTFVHPSTSRPRTPSIDLHPNSGASSVENWSSITLVDSGEPSLNGETSFGNEESDSDASPLVGRYYQPARFLFGSRYGLTEDGEGVVRMLETELDFREADHDDLMAFDGGGGAEIEKRAKDAGTG